MASKIKVDNIENQCGGAVVTKCGATTTISGSVVKADDIQAADGGNIINQCGTTITLGASGDTISLAAGASQTGFGRTGTVDWDTTPKTATFSAVSGDGFFCNTTSSAFTCNLPAGSAGAIVSLADYAGTWQTNNLTVSPNGTDKIGSVNADLNLNTEGQSVTFVYVDSTQGWVNVQDSTSNERANPFIIATGGTVTCCGDYKIHTFTGPGTFTVSKVASCAANNKVDYLVAAGGGGGTTGSPNAARGHAGGGAGGVRFYLNTTCAPMACAPASPRNNFPSGTEVTVTATSFPITVGGGGTKGSPSYSTVTSGANSVFSTITSAGGGAAGTTGAGTNGGSGGGASRDGGANGGIGNTPPVSPSQGSNGGNQPQPAGNAGAGGGGGFMAVGASCTGAPHPQDNIQPGGAGGGFPTAFGTSGELSGGKYYFGGGGGAGSYYSPGTAGAGGLGGGGTGGGSGSPACLAEDGTSNTGGGGGGNTSTNKAGAGGSGIVIIRYKFQ